MDQVKGQLSHLLSGASQLPPLQSIFQTAASLPPQTARQFAQHAVSSLAVAVLQGTTYKLPSSDFPAVERLLKDLPLADTSLKGLDNQLRRWIADRKIDGGDLTGAAETLATLRMDGVLPPSSEGRGEDDDEGVAAMDTRVELVAAAGPYYFPDAEKCDVFVTIAECYLQEDQPVDAEVFVMKAAAVAENVDKEKHEVLLLRYR